MEELKLEMYWNDIPTNKEKAVDYDTLTMWWNCTQRKVRTILHELSYFDNGDNYILIRSSKKKGFYKTDDEETIKRYRKECFNKGKSIFAPLRKIDRVLNANETQFSLANNLRVMREAKGLKQCEVCKQMKAIDTAFDNSLLSKMENGVCLPTPFQLQRLAEIYGATPVELININLY